MARIARAQQIMLPPLEAGSGSLDFAVPVMRPEDDFGIDLFVISHGARVSLTIGGFIKAYENVLA